MGNGGLEVRTSLFGYGVLEEYDPADLEQVPSVIALAHVPAHIVLVPASESEINLLELPFCEHMHGGRVDLLNHAKPIAVDCRALRRYSSAHGNPYSGRKLLRLTACIVLWSNIGTVAG